MSEDEEDRTGVGSGKGRELEGQRQRTLVEGSHAWAAVRREGVVGKVLTALAKVEDEASLHMGAAH